MLVATRRHQSEKREAENPSFLMASNNKYDRQLRLWGADAQKRLSEARVCLLGAGPVGTEALKNLVLPGVGHITIVDDKIVDASDVASNFFAAPGDEGRPLAQVRPQRSDFSARFTRPRPTLKQIATPNPTHSFP